MKYANDSQPSAELLSLPSRERGLKFLDMPGINGYRSVAPLAGAWIEIYAQVSVVYETGGRSPRGSVD